MKHNKSLLVCCLLLILSSTATKAQNYFGNYINQTVTLRSDYPSKSVLVSNLLADRVGDLSPVIGAANWTDSGRQLECRSLLQFNYVFLPGIILTNPSMIISAELVLYPLHVSFGEDDLNKSVKFSVRRVLENWNDSTTMWMNQPVTDSNMIATKLIKKKKRDKPVSIDVTELVAEMIQSGNYGFMICPQDTQNETMALGQLFASPKNEDEEIRPLLVIKYRRMIDPNLSMQYRILEDQRLMQNERRYQSPGSYPVMEPVIQPVVAPEPSPAPAPVNQGPIKD